MYNFEMVIKYHYRNFRPEKLGRHNINRMAVEEVPANSFVLDVGCATGFMGKYLRESKNCKVFGVDNNIDEIRIAKTNLDQALLLDIERDRSQNLILNKSERKKFDVILATSLIEHTADPEKVLKTMINLLKPGGKIVMSTPNIVHWSVRLNLLLGSFDYTDYGIMDETHLKFFTINSFKKLFEKAGLKVERIRIDAEGGGLPRLSIALANLFPNLFAYQIMIVGRK